MRLIMNHYRKKQVVIEAVAFTRNNFDEIVSFTNGTAHSLKIERTQNGKCTCMIPTLEGEHIANEGDYIIRGVKGEFYPCKTEIFCMTYEPIDGKRMTNGDQVRAMSDEELDDLFREIYNAGCDDSTAFEWGETKNSFVWDEEWLKQPAEVV